MLEVMGNKLFHLPLLGQNLTSAKCNSNVGSFGAVCSSCQVRLSYAFLYVSLGRPSEQESRFLLQVLVAWFTLQEHAQLLGA